MAFPSIITSIYFLGMAILLFFALFSSEHIKFNEFDNDPDYLND